MNLDLTYTRNVLWPKNFFFFHETQIDKYRTKGLYFAFLHKWYSSEWYAENRRSPGTPSHDTPATQKGLFNGLFRDAIFFHAFLANMISSVTFIRSPCHNFFFWYRKVSVTMPKNEKPSQKTSRMLMQDTIPPQNLCATPLSFLQKGTGHACVWKPAWKAHPCASHPLSPKCACQEVIASMSPY